MLHTDFDPQTRVLVATSSGTVSHRDYVEVYMPPVNGGANYGHWWSAPLRLDTSGGLF